MLVKAPKDSLHAYNGTQHFWVITQAPQSHTRGTVITLSHSKLSHLPASHN